MKKNWLSLFVVLAMLLGMVSSAAATPGLASSIEPQTGQPVTDYIVARVYFTSQEDLNTLASQLDIWEVNHEQGYFIAMLSPERYAALQQAGYRLEIDEKKTELLNHPAALLPGQGPDSIPGFPCYRTVEETYTSMQDIVTDNPDMAELIPIGMSWDMVNPGGPAGYDILALRLTNENFGVVADKPTFFLMAEIHAREYATAELAMRYAEYLVNNYGIDPDITWLLDYFRVYIVTMTNPDGRKFAEQGYMWRKNTDNVAGGGCSFPDYGIDLNRNSTFKWNSGGSSPFPCDETYMGPSAGSEPEVQAIQTFVMTLFPDQRGPGDSDPAPVTTTGTFITLHSAASLVLWPWGWSPSPSPNGTQLQTLGRHLAYFNGYTPQQSYQLYQTSGTTDEFAYGELGIAGYTFELAGTFFQSCSAFESTDYPDNRDALLYAFKTARRPYMNPAGPDSLDLSASPAAVAPGDPILLTASANGTRYAGGEPTQNIAAAQYTIDSPSWITGTITYPMTASDGNFNSTVEGIQATIDTTGLSAGRHTIFVESKDVGNDWGVLSATFIYVIEPGVSPVIQGYVLEAGTNAPLDASVTAGLFNATTDPATGYYSMTVVSDTYDMVVTAANYAPAYSNGVVAQDYQTIQQDFLLYPVCSFFSDDVESGPQGWTAQSPWAITTESSHSTTHSWTDSPGGNYGNNRNISLTSQVFNLSGYTGVTLSFWHTYMTEPTYDFGYVEYSTDGINWTTVASYDGNHPSWSQEQVPIYGLDGQANARIRFRFYSDTNVTADGWHIDDIGLVAGGPGCMPPSAPVAGFSSNSPVPLGQPMLFTNETTGTEPITYTWNFGDGVGASSEISPSYTYSAIGTYTVTLVATNTFGSDSISHPVTVLPAAIASVDLTQVTTGTVYAGDTVDFSADLLPDNAGKPYTYTIDYGDGTVITATSSLDPLSLSHTFISGGNYTIQIWVSNAVMTIPVTDSLDLNVVVMYKIFLPNTVK
jgi:carboxypeptidase T